MAGEPVQELDSELGFERLGINAWADPAEDVEPVLVRSFEPLGFAGEPGFGGDRKPYIGHAPAVELGTEEPGRRHADHGERMTVDLIAGADHRRIRAILIGPDVIAHDGRGRRAFAIVVIGHEPTDPRLNAEGTEEISRDVFAVAGVERPLRSGAADTEIGITSL